MDIKKEHDWHALAPKDVLNELEASDSGLSGQEAARRLERYGPNELEKEGRASPWKIFLDQFRNILIIILLIATVLSLLVGEAVDAIIIFVIVVFSAVLGFVQEYRAERALEALKKMLHATITVLRDGAEVDVDAALVVPGDVMLLEAGDKVPADGRVLESNYLKCDEAPLTGESLPVSKKVDPLERDLSMGDRVNMVYTGSVVTYGRARAVVTSTGMDTEFGKIAREVAAVETGKTPLELRTQEIGKWLGIGALLICLVVIGVSALREYMSDTLSVQSMVTMLMFGVALAVAAVPEALAAIVTGALAIGMREMAKQNALVRKMSAVETLGSTTVICTDKTGTLTRGEMTVRRLFISGRYYDVSGAGYEPVGDIAIEGSEVASNDALAHMAPLFKAGVLCNDSDLLSQNDGTWAIKGDPTEAALLVLAEKAGYKLEEIRHKEPRQEEIPFSSERKLMSTVNLSDKGYVAYIKGAPEQVLSRSVNILGPDGSVRPITDDDLSSALHAAEEMATSALRVLALAYRDVSAPDVDEKEAEQGLTFAGLAGMMDPPRPEAIEAIATCRKVHIRPVMITGDHKLTAMAVAREMGIYMEGDMVLTGRELEAMSQEEFDRVVDKVSVYARVSPMDKLKIVTAWKHRGEVVAMTGDGVNDAPALKHADIGIAMGLTGTEVAKEAADMVLADDNFATIVRAVELGRWIFDNIKKYLTFLIQCNITEVLVIGGIVLWFGPHYLPLLPAAILYINLATDGLPALALGVAPPDEDIMLRPPRNPRESVFTSDVVSFLARAVILEFPLFIWIYLDSLPDLELARTRIFFMFIIIELVIALNCRSLRFSVFKAPPHKWLIIAIFWEIVMIVVLMQIPQIRESFGVSIPSLSDLLLIFGLGLLVFIVMEAMKMALRAMGDKGLKK